MCSGIESSGVCLYHPLYFNFQVQILTTPSTAPAKASRVQNQPIRELRATSEGFWRVVPESSHRKGRISQSAYQGVCQRGCQRACQGVPEGKTREQGNHEAKGETWKTVSFCSCGWRLQQRDADFSDREVEVKSLVKETLNRMDEEWWKLFRFRHDIKIFDVLM